MVHYSYLTRDNTSPDGKPKVVLSIHPADRYAYFDALANSILSACDCAVYFSESPSDCDMLDPEDVKLVIFAVTEKYLIWNNSGFKSEVLPAVERNIPICPIMLEHGIENLFNTRCGNFHYINCSDSILTEDICEHLGRHIIAILNRKNDTRAENGKSKVFISYRKSNIYELERLVAMIDAHPQSENLSLWYDTSLNPGEDYSKVILENLQSCDLFLLLVTPALLEQGNYVMRVEYPLAVKKNKRILPIIMRKTDLKRLAELYPNIPKCISDNQLGAIFSKALKD